MRVLKNVIQITTISFLILSCRPFSNCSHFDIPFTNQSTVSVYHAYTDVLDSTDWEKFNDLFGNDWRVSAAMLGRDSQYNRVLSGATETNILRIPNGCWSEYFKPGDRYRGIFVYVIDSAVLYSQPWDSIVAHRAYSKVYKVNYDSIVKMNWHIVYP